MLKVACLFTAIVLSAAAHAQTVTFATLPPGSILHAQASVIAKVIQDNTKLQVRVVGYGGDTGILEAVNSKKADFWMLDVGESADAFHGRNTWKGNAEANLRTATHAVPVPDGVLGAQGLEHQLARRSQGQARARPSGCSRPASSRTPPRCSRPADSPITTW